MPPKSDFAHVTQLITLNFLTSKSTRAEFAFDDAELLLQVEAHAPGVYRVRCGASELLKQEKLTPRVQARADMLLARHEPVGELTVCSSLEPAERSWRVEQGDMILELQHSPLRLALYRDGELLFQTQEDATLARQGNDEASLWRLGIELDPDDALHGLGESKGDLDRRGEFVVSDLPAARALPLMWSTRGWGLYCNTLERVEHDLGREDPDVYTISVHDDVFDLFIFMGEPTEILNQYTALTGRAGQPNLWPMGVWLDQAPGQSLDEVLELVEEFRENHWGLDAVRLAAPAWYGFQEDKPSFEWDAARVSDVREMLARSEALNVQLAVPTFPGVLAGTQLFEDWEDRGWLLLDDESGSAHVFPGTPESGGRPFGLLDLTHKDVYKLWSERQRQVSDDGIGAPACNAHFDIPDGITARGGESGALLRTTYPILARQALFDAVAGHKTPQEGVVLSTDLFPSVQRFAWQVGPQVSNDWAGLEQTLRAALALGDSGITAQTHNLGSCFAPTDTMTPELYIRWLAMSVFSANFNFQALPALQPGAFDAATRELITHWLQWRYRLVPYVLGIIEDAVRSGLPVQRSMALAFPGDAMAQVWDTQYMLGPALLVAPALKPGKNVEVYLPSGEAWWDLNTGWRYEGGTTWTVEAELNTLPIFGREGHMLCLGPTAQHTGEYNSARILDEVWMFGMPEHSPVVMRNKIRVMQMQGSSYIKGLEGLRILPCEGLEVKRRGAEVRISRLR